MSMIRFYKQRGIGQLYRVLRPELLLLIIVVVTSANLFSSCVYFNLYYNAKKVYREAEKAPRAPDGNITRPTADLYGKVIEKCELLITRHPDSKYVDDAVLLMGKCFYETQEYDLAITKFEELKANFPQSNLNEEGHLYLARCYIAKESPAQAVPILESLYQAKPDSKHADQVLFYLGTGSIYIGDEDNAVKYLEILADKYPGSPLRLNADIEMADLYTDRGDYEKALAIYDKLAGVNLNAENSIRYLSKLSVVYVRMGCCWRASHTKVSMLCPRLSTPTNRWRRGIRDPSIPPRRTIASVRSTRPISTAST
jgi:outer membrane protein assembly factor BamD (BamD/ComL family)